MTTQTESNPLQLLKVDNPADTNALINELAGIQQRSVDYIVPQAKMDLVADALPTADPTRPYVYSTTLSVQLPTTPYPVRYNLRPIAHEHMASITGIGQHYYRKLHDGKHRDIRRLQLLARNVNYWLHEAPGADLGKLWTVRTIGDEVRAVLSNAYFALDNWELTLHAANVANRVGAIVQSLRLSEEKLYIRLMLPDWAVRVDLQNQQVRSAGLSGLFGGITDAQGGMAHTVGQLRSVDTSKVDKTSENYRRFAEIATSPGLMVPMVIISSSEVGRGGLNIASGIWEPYCTNCAAFMHTFGRVHRGSRLDEGLISPETRKLQSAAVWAEVEDFISNTFDEDAFTNYVQQYMGLAQLELREPVTVIDNLSKATQQVFTEDEKTALMQLLIGGGYGATAFAVVSAITEYAHRQPDEDRRHELERLGGDLIEKFPRELVVVRR